MKKKLFKVLAAALTVCAIFTQTGAAYAEEASDTVNSYLTGEQIPAAIGRRRPVAVMMGNTKSAVPQSGIASAGVIYEAPVEGDITRLMGIFDDYDSLEKIGSMRSCRDYYLFYANEFDAIYVHYGQSAFALPFLEQHLVDNLNGIQLGNTSFYRTSDRPAPHNAYTSYEGIQKGIQTLGYRQELKDDYNGHYVFASDKEETTLEEGTAADILRLDNFPVNHPWFEYNEETKKYSRFQYGAPQIDELTGEQLTCDNIILQYSSYRHYDNTSYLNVDVMPSGKGKFITRGKAVDVRWEKDAPWGITHYYDQNEQEIRLNPGKTWVEIVQDDRLDSVTYQ